MTSRRTRRSKAGYAIWSLELTRQSLFDAAKVRRCYGTTGARIVVRFSIDWKPMGSKIAARRLDEGAAGRGRGARNG